MTLADGPYLEKIEMAHKKDWKYDREFLPGDEVEDEMHQRRGLVVERNGENSVIVEFGDGREEVRIERLRRLNR